MPTIAFGAGLDSVDVNQTIHSKLQVNPIVKNNFKYVINLLELVSNMSLIEPLSMPLHNLFNHFSLSNNMYCYLSLFLFIFDIRRDNFVVGIFVESDLA